MNTKRIAIVIPWFGSETTGGAEQQAAQIATRLAARKHRIEVLTTCNRSFHDDWSVNHYYAGSSDEDGVPVRRFTVDSRDRAAFDRVNAKLLALDRSTLRAGVNPITANEAHTFVNENIKSAALLDYLRAEQENYHAFIFLPYMFAPVVLGLPIVSDRAWLQPCLHDESAAYLPEVAAMFRQAHGLLFNSSGEMELALRLFGPGIFTRSQVVGEGIEFDDSANNAGVDLPADLTGERFVLYLGRRDRTKNTDLLVRSFARFKSTHGESSLQLVLAGPGSVSFAANSVHDLGFVSGDLKRALLDQCLALAQPSHHESFSRTMMEAWVRGRPVVAQRECLATATAVKEADGGFLATDENEWAEVFARLDEMSEGELSALGGRGRAYAAQIADWKKVIPRYEQILNLPGDSKSNGAAGKRREPRSGRRPSRKIRAVHQLLPDIAYGDAISNQARAIRNQLRNEGFDSEIFVKRRAPQMQTEALLWDESQPSANDALLYHHSIGSELTSFAVNHAGPKCLIYHNITPAKYFAGYRPGFAWMLETGRAHLPRIARYFSMSVGDSAYNAAELTSAGFNSPGVLPIIVDSDRWNIEPDSDLMRRLQDGKTNILFVGRIAPNKQQHRLLEIFASYHSIDPDSRLIFAGEARPSDTFSVRLRHQVHALGLSQNVEIAGQVDDAALLAYYRTAHLYCSPSAHEGFGAPLIEAMWFDIPVLALRAAAVPETLGDAGMLFDEDEPPASVAARAFQLTHDRDVRDAVIAIQRQRRSEFRPIVISSRVREMVAALTTVHGIRKSRKLIDNRH